MRILNIMIILIFGLFSVQGWAPPIKGGATGGAEAAADISKCDLNPSKQTKIKLKGKDGKEHFICTGQAICGGKGVPVSCKVSEREQCPVAKVCLRPDFGVYKEYWTANCKVAQFKLPDGFYFVNKEIQNCKVLKGVESYPGSGIPDKNIYKILGTFYYMEWTDPLKLPDPNEPGLTKYFVITLREGERSLNQYSFEMMVDGVPEGSFEYTKIWLNDREGLIITSDPNKQVIIQLRLGKVIRTSEDRFNKKYEIRPNDRPDFNLDIFVKK